ncbi:Ig-like domain-containing protein [Alistipes sp. OttesenSCG-928-B03]|nr:Ig-like domain-containing protein [Alistipes sp. OttesenSCG-928-B03]
MRAKKSKISRFAVQLGLAVFFCTGLLARCANPMAPQGGPKDTIAPKVVNMTPGLGTKNFKGRRIYIEFDEYVKLQDQQKEFFTSPGMKRKPTLTLKGRGIQIDILDTLLPNQTYALDFAGSIRDNNEGNPLNGFRYVFSTGDEIDSLVMSGYTADAYKADSVSKTFICFFDPSVDSIPQYDSVMFNCMPEAIARAENNGIFLAQNLKAKPYRIYAYQDANHNQKYDPGTDKIGFLDSVYNPVGMPDFTAWYDTIRRYTVADPQLYFRMFTDEMTKRQSITKHERGVAQRLTVVFGAPYPQIERFEFLNIDSTRVITEYLRPTRDSINYWLDIPEAELPDTVKTVITFMKHDSTNTLVPTPQNLNFAWRRIESREQERERLDREKAREEAIAEGREPEKEPNPFKVSVGVSGEVNPEKEIGFTFDYPLTKFDSTRITLRTTAEDAKGEGASIPFRFVRDTMNIRKWSLFADWQPGQKAQLVIPEGVFENIAGERNDTLRSNIMVMDPAKYAVVIVEVTGKTPESEYVLQLLNEGGSTILNEIRHARTGTHKFNYVAPGKVQIRVIEDMNGNGEWDGGNLVQRRQPERVEMHMFSAGETLLTTRPDWEMSTSIDMNELFAPVTIETLRQRLREMEDVRLKKILEEREKRRQQGGNNQQRGNQQMIGPGELRGIF